MGASRGRQRHATALRGCELNRRSRSEFVHTDNGCGEATIPLKVGFPQFARDQTPPRFTLLFSPYFSAPNR